MTHKVISMVLLMLCMCGLFANACRLETPSSTGAPTPLQGGFKGKLLEEQSRQPLAGATVVLAQCCAENEWVLKADLATTTDNEGNFVLPSVESGSYLVLYDLTEEALAAKGSWNGKKLYFDDTTFLQCPDSDTLVQFAYAPIRQGIIYPGHGHITLLEWGLVLEYKESVPQEQGSPLQVRVEPDQIAEIEIMAFIPSEVAPPEEESTMPILTDGTHRWRLKATTFGEQEIETGSGYSGQVYEAIEGHVFLQAEFENLSEVDLIDAFDLETTGGEMPDLTEIYTIQGIGGIYVTDSQGNSYPAVILSTSEITFVVPRDGHGFTLYFLDWAPIELVKEADGSALGDEDYRGELEALIQALKDEDKDVRESAAEALGDIGDPRAVEPLIEVLKDKDEDEDVRVEAAKALGDIGDPRAVEPLIGALKDKDEDVGYVAAQALGEIGDARAVEPLIQALKDKGLRFGAVIALHKIGDVRAVEPLIHTLNDNNWWVRQLAAEALGEIGDARAVEPLIAALKDDERDEVRGEAAAALGKIGDARAVEPLIEAVRDDESWRVREDAGEALGEIGDAWAVEARIEALRDEDKSVRAGAARGLGKIGDPRAVEPLIEVLNKDDESYVRLCAATALGKIGDARAVEPLIEVLNNDEDWYLRSRVAEALGKIGDVRAVEVLIAALKDGHGSIRVNAAEALGEIGDARAVKPLTEALSDENPSVRIAAQEALEKIR